MSYTTLKSISNIVEECRRISNSFTELSIRVHKLEEKLERKKEPERDYWDQRDHAVRFAQIRAYTRDKNLSRTYEKEI
jgi:hypothetical protein